METFNVTSLNRKAFIPVVLAVIVAAFVLAFLLFDPIMLLRFLSAGPGIFIVLLVITTPLLLFRKVFAEKYIVHIHTSKLLIERKGQTVINIPLQNISLIRVKNTGFTQMAELYESNAKPFFTMYAADKNNTENKRLVAALQQATGLIKTNTNTTKNSHTTDYINKNAVQTGAVQQVQQGLRTKRKRVIAGFVMFFILIIFVLILPFFINPKAFYSTEGNKVYFGKKEMTGVNAAEFTTLTYNVAKDSSRIYFRGEPLNFVDYKTFAPIASNNFFRDKNGLYYETVTMYSKIKILPLEGVYDKATFHELGSYNNLFADKNHVYSIDVFANPPLRIADVPGMDVKTLRYVSSTWITDTNTVYFDDMQKLRPCKEIDRATFMVLTARVAKDKQNVYYLSNLLKTKEKDATDKFSYAILNGADAGTFEMIHENEFIDKNSVWTISKEGEETYHRDERAGRKAE